MNGTARPLTAIPSRRVDPGTWPVLERARGLGWPPVTGIPAGRHYYLLNLLNFREDRYLPPDLDRVRVELEAIASARVLSVPRFLVAHAGAGPVTPERYNRAWAAARAEAEPLEERLGAAYATTLRKITRAAAGRFRHTAHAYASITADATPPRWALPSEEEVYDLALAALALRKAGEPRRVEIARTLFDAAGVALGLSFDLANPLARGVLEQFGHNIVAVAEDHRREIMVQLEESHAAGDGIREAARKLVEWGGIDSITRARRIARTELAGLTNGASTAAMRLAGIGWHSWLSTEDAKTRPEHADADGQTVPVGQPFQVGGVMMAYPGDPNAPADLTVNCRCTTIAADGP